MRAPAFLLLLAALPASAQPADDAEDQAMARRLQDALRAHGGDVFTCWTMAQRGATAPGGELLVRLWIAPGGAVDKAEVLKDEARAPGLGECLLSGMRTWRLPELSGPEVRQVVFPLAFRPEPGEAPSSAPPPDRVRVAGADVKPLPASPKSKLAVRPLVDLVTVGATGLSLTHLVLSPSARLAYHGHPGGTEILYVLKGRAHLRNGWGEMLPAETGDGIIVAKGAVHSLEAAPLAPLELLQAFVPAGAEQDYRNPPTLRRGTSPGAKVARPQGAPDDLSVRVTRAALLRPTPLAGGRGSMTVLSGDEVGGLARLDLDAGDRLSGRVSPAEEVLFVLSGKGELALGGQRHPFVAGDALRLPASTAHDLLAGEKTALVRWLAPRP